MALGLIGALVLVIVAALAFGNWIGFAFALALLLIGGLGLARYVQKVTNGGDRRPARPSTDERLSPHDVPTDNPAHRELQRRLERAEPSSRN